jgi:hypothetical protein
VTDTTHTARDDGDGVPAATRVDPHASCLRFVYPFAFEGARLEALAAAAAGARWASAKRDLTVWRREHRHTDDVLAAVASYIDPPPGTPLTSAFWSLDGDALRSPAGLGAGAEPPGANWSVELPSGPAPFEIRAVDLALFRHGIGLLTFDAAPTGTDAAVWFDFVHHVRFADGDRAPAVRAARTTGVDAATRQPVTEDFFPEWVTPRAGSGRRVLGQVAAGLLGMLAPGAWWDEVFVPGMMIPFVALYVDGVAEEEGAAVVYRARNFFHGRQLLHAAPDDLRLDGPGVLGYAHNQWFTFSMNGGAFIAVDAPHTEFFRVTLPEHITDQYFVLFLLALVQRFVLMVISHEVARRWITAPDDSSPEGRAAAFAAIRDRFLSFTAQGYFAQVMQQEHHHRCYVGWQEAFQIARLYQEVGDEVREMHSHVELAQRQRIERLTAEREAQARRAEKRVGFAGWIIGVPVWIFVVINSVGGVSTVRGAFAGHPVTTEWYDVAIAASVFVIGVCLGAFVHRALTAGATRSRERRDVAGVTDPDSGGRHR